MNRDHASPPPLTPDDPRLSEWLDGRLTVAEAAEIERLVAASPELTRLVADLRGIRGGLAAMPVTPPPDGFVRDVLAALDGPGAAAADEADVEEEWRRIERQRLDEEIDAAEDDLSGPVADPMRRRWPWMALAGALAAGVLATVVINRPQVGRDRDVALVGQRDRDPLPREKSQAKGREQHDGEPLGGLLVDGDLPDKESAAARTRRAGAGLEGREPEALAIEQRPGRQDGTRLADRPQLPAGDAAAGLQAGGGPPGFGMENRSRVTASGTGDFRGRMVAGGGGVPGGGGGGGDGDGADGRRAAGAEGAPLDRWPPLVPQRAADNLAKDASVRPRTEQGGAAELGDAPAVGQEVARTGVRLRSDGGVPAIAQSAPPAAFAAAAAGSVQPVRTVTYRIRTASDRLRLDELLASHAGMWRRLPADPGKTGPSAAAELREKDAGEPPRSPAEPATAAPGTDGLSPQKRARERAERLVFSGPPQALASLAAAIDSAQGSSQGGNKPAKPSASLDAATARDEEAKSFERNALAAEASQREDLALRAGLAGEGSAAGRGDGRGGGPPGEAAVEAGVAASGKNSETTGLLVIEIVDESGVAGGEVEP